MTKHVWLLAVCCAVASFAPFRASAEDVETAKLTFAPEVPPAITRKNPAIVKVELKTEETNGTIQEGISGPTTYPFWTFNGRVPGPFIRVRQGDTIELSLANGSKNAMAHSIDLHAVTGPGGGAALTLAQPGETKVARFKMLRSGLFLYHCAAPPVTDHIANGMYGLILVEPLEGLSKVDKEFYVMQSEIYTKQDGDYEGPASYDAEKARAEQPTYVVFNGRRDGLQEERALKAKVGETVRIFFGDAGPNKISSFHIIGTIFDKVYREGGFESAPDKGIQTTLVPAGGSTVVELKLQVPGNYTLVDHAIFRLEKGAAGTLTAEGPEAPDIYKSVK